MMERLKPFLAVTFAVALAAGLAGGAYAFFRFAEGREDQALFWAGVVYGGVVALFLAATLAVVQFLALNVIFHLFPDIDFEGLKIPILVIEAGIGVVFVALLAWILPLPFGDL